MSINSWTDFNDALGNRGQRPVRYTLPIASNHPQLRELVEKAKSAELAPSTKDGSPAVSRALKAVGHAAATQVREVLDAVWLAYDGNEVRVTGVRVKVLNRNTSSPSNVFDAANRLYFLGDVSLPAGVECTPDADGDPASWTAWWS